MIQFFQEILNLEGIQNRIIGSRVTPILLNRWILPIGGASTVEGLLSTGPTPSSLTNKVVIRLVYIYHAIILCIDSLRKVAVDQQTNKV